MNVYLPNLRLPSAYQEVEYIESDTYNVQYINTGYLPTSNPKIELDFMYINGVETADYVWFDIYGRRGSTNSTYIGMYINNPNGYVSPNYAGFDTGQNSGVTISKNTRYYHIQDRGQFYLNGTKYANASTTNTLATANYPVFLFGNNMQGTVQGRVKSMRVYSCKMWNDGVLVRNFIPCYRKSDSVIGLYDLVNNQFYTNSGTGTFSKGNDVTMAELKNAYIGEYHREWTPNDHTLLYLPLESDVVDRSGKSGRTFTTSGLSYTTVGGVSSVHVGTTGGAYLTAPQPIVTPSVSNQTISILTYVTSQQTSDRRNILEWRVQNNVGTVLAFEGGTTEIRAFGDSVGDMVSANIIANQRMHIVLTNCSEGKKLYLNGELVSTGAGVSSPRGSWAYSYQQSQGILCRRGGDYGLGMNGNARELIAEDTIWSAEDVSNYYQRIKTKLGF